MSPNSKISHRPSESPEITNEPFGQPRSAVNPSLGTPAASSEVKFTNVHGTAHANDALHTQQDESASASDGALYSSGEGSLGSKREHLRRNLNGNPMQQSTKSTAELSGKSAENNRHAGKRIRLSASSSKATHDNNTPAAANDDNADEEGYTTNTDSCVSDAENDTKSLSTDKNKRSTARTLNYGLMNSNSLATDAANFAGESDANCAENAEQNLVEEEDTQDASHAETSGHESTTAESADSAAATRGGRLPTATKSSTAATSANGLLSKDYKDLKQKLINERIAAINCELEALENGVHPELAIRLQAIEKTRDSRLKIAENRKSYETKAILETFLCAAAEATNEYEAAQKELHNAYLSRLDHQNRARRKRLILMYKKHQKSHLTEQEALMMAPPKQDINEADADVFLVYKERLQSNSLTYDLTLIKDE